MIILSDKYTLTWDKYSWKVTTKVPSNHRLAKNGFAKEDRWFPNLRMVFEFIFDDQIKDCKDYTLEGLHQSIDESLGAIRQMVDTIKNHELL